MSALLEVKHADISFGGIHAVKDLSFIVHAGEIVGLIGPNGSENRPASILSAGPISWMPARYGLTES